LAAQEDVPPEVMVAGRDVADGAGLLELDEESPELDDEVPELVDPVDPDVEEAELFDLELVPEVPEVPEAAAD
jgi:hypothetical protein